MIKSILICILAGFGAGVSTGFLGLSAAVFITPVLIALLQLSSFDAIGIALASDVLASAISAWTYGKNGNLDLKNARPMMGSVFLVTILGSVLAYHLTTGAKGNDLMSKWMILGAIALGIRFALFPVQRQREKTVDDRRRMLLGLGSGTYIGFVCGFQGTGGGMLMLFALHALLGYPLKKAVGTSVFIMSITALIGAGSHFLVGGSPDPVMLGSCVVSTTVFARLAAGLANRLEERILGRSVGIMLLVAGAGMAMIYLLT